jgi:BolA protein
MTVAETVHRKLTEALSPTRLVVTDDSHHHAGHSGARPGGETHFGVEVVSAAFIGKSRLQRQRMVYDLLAQELKSGIHALALRTITPDEDR